MCFHNSMSKRIRQLARRYGRKTDLVEMVNQIVEEEYHINAFNYPVYPIITRDQEIQPFYWGLIPHWVRTEEQAKEIRNMTLNARAESIFQKRSFSRPALTKRCLIPSTGYFEWRHEGKQKIPYYIFLKDEEVFSMAGLYDIWVDEKTNSSIMTFTQITTDANPLTGYIHNTKKRMPAIISREKEEKWLSPDLGKEEIQSLLTPYDADKMAAYVVDRSFLAKNPHDPSIVEKAE